MSRHNTLVLAGPGIRIHVSGNRVIAMEAAEPEPPPAAAPAAPDPAPAPPSTTQE